MISLEKARSQVLSNIERATQLSKQSNSPLLLAVSKRHSAEKIRSLFDCGQRDFGENYLNESLEKQHILNELDITWHFIGHIQSNKTRKVASHFDWVHTVDSLKIAKRLSAQRPDDMPPLNICLQINIDKEVSKSGLLPNHEALLAIAQEVNTLPNLRLRGLMCIPAPKNHPEEERQSFMRMAKLKDFLNDNGLSLDTLSMGMSDDLESAIACGATIVRVGTAIFGARE